MVVLGRVVLCESLLLLISEGKDGGCLLFFDAVKHCS